MELRNISGFEFVKVGRFVSTDIPYNFKRWSSYLKIEFFDERYESADETAYVLTTGDSILYAGEFTCNLKDRWLSRGYVNHHMYDNIEEFLKSDKELFLWLAVAPYCSIENYGEINISKSLEQQVIKDFCPPWNRRNKHSGSPEWRKRNCIKLNTYIKTP